MSDEELRSELLELKVKMEKLARFGEVARISSGLVTNPLHIIALRCEWVMEEYADTPDGLIDLKVLLNQRVIVQFEIPVLEAENIAHSAPRLLSDYQSTASSAEVRQIKLASEMVWV